LTVTDPFPTGDLPSQVVDGYLRAIDEGWLALERCDHCQRLQWYPRGFCIVCGSDQVALVPAEGTGSLYTYSIVYRAPSAPFAPFAPYVYALVDLVEGLRVTVWITDCDHEALAIGMPLELHFMTGPEGRRLAVFRPASGASATRGGA
jgi:uncharacterized OB-fold protein